MKNDPIQAFVLRSPRNLRIAASVGDTWPEIRGNLVTGFLDRLHARLMKKLKGWKCENYEGRGFFVTAYAGYYFYKPTWENQYGVGLQSESYGQTMTFGVYREKHNVGKRPFCQELFDAIRKVHPSAQQMAWWEAKIVMHSPASEWRKPEVLWRMHKDGTFLEEVAEQLLDVARVSEQIVDRLARKK